MLLVLTKCVGKPEAQPDPKPQPQSGESMQPRACPEMKFEGA